MFRTSYRMRWRSGNRPFSIGGTSLADYINAIKSLSPIGYWPMSESSGTTSFDASGNSRNGTYSGVILGSTGIGDGNTAPLWPGTTAYNNIYSVSLRDVFDGSKGSISLFVSASGPSVWTDGSTRLFVGLRVDAQNYVQIYKSSTNHVLYEYRANNTPSQFGSANPGYTHLIPGDGEWHHFGITWDKAQDRVRAYWHGSQAGPDLTGLGVWAGSITSTQSVIGALTTALFPWSGRLAHVAIFNYELTSSQMKTISMNYTKSSILAFGDSITAGTGATSESNRWVNIVRSVFGGGTFRNAGLSATVLQNTTQNTVNTIGAAADNNGRDTVTTRVLPYNPDYVFVLYGFNDIRLNDASFSDTLFENDLGETIDLIVSNGTPANQIVIGSPPYLPEASYALGGPEYDGGSVAKHSAYISACANVAASRGTKYVDVYQWMIDNGGDSLISGDGIHPNDTGHAQIAAAFLSVL